jgi:hypothetical protein
VDGYCLEEDNETAGINEELNRSEGCKGCVVSEL